MKNPLIGITCNFLSDISGMVQAGIAAPGQSWHLLADDYIRSVRAVGGVPVILPTDETFDRALPLVQALDGIVLSGGNDVTPALYNERIGQLCGPLDPERDRFELALARYALEKDLPLLGICRGIQIMNVALGGTLYQDLSSAGYELHTILTNTRNVPTHGVAVVDGTPLKDIFGETSVAVNSFHHQGVRDIPSGLKPAARSEDNLTEAVYVPGKRFALAVQWHPEMMYDSPQQAKIFSAFVDACRSGKEYGKE